MIHETHGDLFQSDSQVLVNPVNCVGVMGKGLAKAFADRFPSILTPYKRACASNQLRPGQVQFLTLPDGTVIANLPTKDHWRNPSQLDWVAAGLDALVAKMTARGLSSVALPPLGCGLGGLRLDQVRPEVERAFAGTPDIRVLFYTG